VHLLWFVPSMGDEARLGDVSTRIKPTLDHLVHVARTAEAAGFEGMLVPTGEMCLDAWMVAATLAQHTERIKFLVAFRPGFVNPPVAARMAATLDSLTGGRILLNVVTGGHLHELAKDGDFVRDDGGEWREVDHDSRYRRTAEFMDVVTRSWHERDWEHSGEFFRVANGGVAQRPAQRPHPPIYLGGASDAAMETAARYADVYLMWGEPVELMAERAARAKQMAADLGRTIEVGTRFQIVCRETDAAARADAEDIVGSIAESFREKMRSHADRTDSVGQQRQNALRGTGSDEQGEWLSDVLWNGFARARMGASVALVGSGESIRNELARFVDAGIDTFILSGYRHDQEAARVGRFLIAAR
jgi:alkanesulfonate monooxygenase